MGSSNIRDILTSFSPSLDFFAISSGDGRIKIWDTVKGQIQTEFSDIVSTDEDGVNLFTKPERGHLSVDYTCMKWLNFDKKKKRKLGSSLLVLGTGSGDILALDVAAGQLKWRVSDCHPGGVSSISFSANGSCIYSAGADGMICELDSSTGNLLRKFKASTKTISSISVSSDGKMLATAAAQLKIFSCSDHTKIQKFSGHPGSVRCMVFTEDGKYVLSSAVAERYVAVWSIDGSKKKSSCCVLSMDNPAVFIDCRYIHSESVHDVGFCVLAISETGVCYLWYAKNIEELRNAKPTKVFSSLDDNLIKNAMGAASTIYAAKLQSVIEPASAHVFVAYGSLIKPSFEKIVVYSGTDLKLKGSLDGILLPISQSHKSKKGSHVRNEVTVQDRANAEDAVLPVPKIFDLLEKKKRQQSANLDSVEVTADNLVNGNGEVKRVAKKGNKKDRRKNLGAKTDAICIEDRLKRLGMLPKEDDLISDSVLDPQIAKEIDFEANVPQRKMRKAILSMAPSDAHNLLKSLVTMWLARSCSGEQVLPWICCILVNHSGYIISQEPTAPVLDLLSKLTNPRGGAISSLLQLSGRLQLVMAQIDKGAQNKNQNITHEDRLDESEDDVVDEHLYGEDDEESHNSSDDDN